MKNRPYAVQRNPDSGTTTFGEFGPERCQKGFDLCPLDRRWDRILENPGKCVAVTVVQRGERYQNAVSTQGDFLRFWRTPSPAADLGMVVV